MYALDTRQLHMKMLRIRIQWRDESMLYLTSITAVPIPSLLKLVPLKVADEKTGCPDQEDLKGKDDFGDLMEGLQLNNASMRGITP